MTELNDTTLTRELLALCKRTKDETGYDPMACRSMLVEHKGIKTLCKLIIKEQPQSSWALGFTTLWKKKKRLDLSLEWFILQEPWRSWLVSQGMQNNIDEAEHRLREVGYLDKVGYKR